jgi:hypothetical protein
MPRVYHGLTVSYIVPGPARDRGVTLDVMKTKLIGSLLISLGLLASGCIVHTHNNHRHGKRGCSQGHHWNGKRCVHNGHGHGNGGKGGVIVRDHRR